MVIMEALPCRVPTLMKKSRLFTKAHDLFYANICLQNPSPSNPSYLSENFASILDRCLNINFLKKVHACIFVHGLENNSYLGSKLLNSYARFDLLTESRWVFNKIIDDNLSLWKSSFAGYSGAGHNDEVLRLYLELRRSRIGIDSSAVTFCLKSCTQLGNFEFGKTVHADTYKFGLNAGCFVGSSLIGLYLKYDDIEVAAKVFDEITNKDVVVYTSMVTGYAQVGDYRSYKAFEVVQNMQEECEPNRVTLVSLLQAASHLGTLKEGKSIHGYAIRRGIGWLDEVFQTSLMNMYMRSGPPDKAAVTFGKMSNRKTIGSWNALIAGHLQSGYPLEGLQLFLQMLQENYIPDLITLANGLLSCAHIGDLARGKCIHGYILRNFVLDLVAMTALIDMYSKCKRLSLAREVFDRMDTKDTGTFNVMIAGYLENGFASRAVEKFHEMISKGCRPNVSTILNLLAALSNSKDARQVKCVQGFVLKHGFEVSTEITNQLIHIYTNCCSISCARKVFERVRNKDIVSWTSMITGYFIHGLADEALILFQKMQKENINPDGVTLVSLLQAFAQLGYLSLAREIHCHVYRTSLDEDISILNSLLTTYSKSGKLNTARNLFDDMAEQSLATWNTMISAYGMHGDCVEALKLFEQMKKDKVVPDDLTFRSLLSACSHSGLIDEGLSVFQSMKDEYDIIPTDEHYSCVIDLLSRAGHLEEACNLVKCLSSTGSSSALRALLAACRVYGNTNMGQMIGRRLQELEPQNVSTYSLVSNLYAEQEKWEEVAKLRGNTKERGLKSVAGYSVIDFG